MTKFSVLAATAVIATAIVGPALAQEVIYNPGYCAQFYPNANCQNKGAGNPYTGDYQRDLAYRDDGYRQVWNQDWNNGWYQNWNDNSSVWPGDVMEGAVGTTGTIATAPFRAGDAYAYDNRTSEDRFGTGYAHSDYYANAMPAMARTASTTTPTTTATRRVTASSASPAPISAATTAAGIVASKSDRMMRATKAVRTTAFVARAATTDVRFNDDRMRRCRQRRFMPNRRWDRPGCGCHSRRFARST